ncbi:unnamed protein product [Spirodela intermedia]|uniref:Uncharacterized protein n=2 Tax=Spirodela intermedia TaxID=51605 RepID=A0A7I8IX59_SPIIN|nr:unnamed protein product [Spirodela intermedia]CAA6662264.1 unnamed protein product [Spirodela intermedia]CAA7398659.1 unnamed protein product [Spirodela intermedia]
MPQLFLTCYKTHSTVWMQQCMFERATL